ncbi:MAG: prolyl-tRNA synthetase associated domain-containing protein [Dongiaceae bacterium]
MNEDPNQESRDDGPAPADATAAGLPTSPEQLLARLQELGIAQSSHRHEPVFTVEEAKRLRGELPGAHIKNLFLRNKKGRMWLVVLDEDRKVDLAALGDRLGAGRFSFGSPERLMAHLGVLPGAVTPLALVNARAGAVQPVIDAAILRKGPVNCHPLTNDMTTALAPEDLLRFIEACGHRPDIVDFDAA